MGIVYRIFKLIVSIRRVLIMIVFLNFFVDMTDKRDVSSHFWSAEGWRIQTDQQSHLNSTKRVRTLPTEGLKRTQVTRYGQGKHEMRCAS